MNRRRTTLAASAAGAIAVIFNLSLDSTLALILLTSPRTESPTDWMMTINNYWQQQNHKKYHHHHNHHQRCCVGLRAAKNDMASTSTNSIMDIREIMDLLERTYPTDSISSNTTSRKERWAKTRRYLYQYRASCMNNSISGVNTYSYSANHMHPSSLPVRQRNKTSSKRSRREPLTLFHIQRILSFLSSTFPNLPHLQAKILQESPRILGQHRSIESKLIPTVEFLKKLYGDMHIVSMDSCSSFNVAARSEDDGTILRDNEIGKGMFFEAISRNTNLLLVRGVGYAIGGESGTGRKDTDDGSNNGNSSDSNNIMMMEEYLHDELGITSRAIISKLKEDHPTLFQSSLNGRVRPVVRYLQSLLGSEYNNNHYDIDAAVEIAADDGEVFELAISPPSKVTKRVAKIVTTYPMILQLDVHTNLVPTVQFLLNSCNFSHEEFAHVISVAPGILGLSVERNLRPTIDILGNIIRGEWGDGGSGSSNGIRSVSDCYQDVDEELSKTSLLRKCILKHPQILALSLDNLRAKRDYFNDIDSFREMSADDYPESTVQMKSTLAARILTCAPSTYSLSLGNNIIPKVEFLTRFWGDNYASALCNHEYDTNGRKSSGRCNVSDNLREYPQILTLSKEGNIIPTLSFYNMTGYVRLDSDGLPMEMPQSKVVIRGRYIATSLYNRLLPRWHFLLREQENRQLLELTTSMPVESLPKYILPTSKNPLSPPSSSSSSIASEGASLPPLHLLAGASDEVFCRQMRLSLEEYLDFKQEAVPRLKFSSQFDRWLKTGRPID